MVQKLIKIQNCKRNTSKPSSRILGTDHGNKQNHVIWREDKAHESVQIKGSNASEQQVRGFLLCII
jgi:hypothetical protein